MSEDLLVYRLTQSGVNSFCRSADFYNLHQQVIPKPIYVH